MVPSCTYSHAWYPAAHTVTHGTQLHIHQGKTMKNKWWKEVQHWMLQVKQHELYSVMSAWIITLLAWMRTPVLWCADMWQADALLGLHATDEDAVYTFRPLTARVLTHLAIQNYCLWTATYWNCVILIWDRNKLYKAITLHIQIFISNQLENICLVTFNLVHSSNTYFPISYSRNSEMNLTIFTTFVYPLHMRSNINVLPRSINSAHVSVFLQFIQLQSVQ